MTDLTEAQRVLLLEAARSADGAIGAPADPKPTKWCCQSNGNSSPAGRSIPKLRRALGHD